MGSGPATRPAAIVRGTPFPEHPWPHPNQTGSARSWPVKPKTRTGRWTSSWPSSTTELRQIAHRHLQRQAPGHTIRTTALVLEAYLKLAGSEAGGWRDRAHFMATAARVMRHVLVDHARRRGAEKRGGTRVRIPLEEAEVGAAPASDLDLMALDAALTELTERDARLGRLVECRFFGGMTMPEVADALQLSLRTAERHWTRARVYLYRALATSSSA